MKVDSKGGTNKAKPNLTVASIENVQLFMGGTSKRNEEAFKRGKTQKLPADTSSGVLKSLALF